MQEGVYFITVCTQDQQCLFGEIVDGEIRLNDAWRMVQAVWEELSIHYPGVEGDGFVVMPNHFHGIIVIADVTVGADLRVGPNSEGTHAGAPLHLPQIAPLSTIVQWFKTMTTNEYMRGVKTQGWPPFHGKLWQGNYYEHVFRDDESLNRIRQYITDNPSRWAFDRENPAVTSPEPEKSWLT